MRKYNIINLERIEDRVLYLAEDFYRADILIERGNLIKNRSHFSTQELCDLTDNFTNLGKINNQIPEKKYEFLLIKKR
jgi:hypothetical protein